MIPKSDFLKLCKDHLGKELFKAPLIKLKEFARLLYKSYVASLYSRYTAFHIVTILSSKEIENYLKETIDLNKKYGVFYDTVDYDLSPASMDKNIAKSNIPGYTTILKSIAENSNAAAAPRKAPVKKATSPKKVVKVNSPKKTTGPKKAVKVNSPKKGVKTTVTPKVPLIRKAPAAKTLVKVRTCKEYKITELKQMARQIGMRGYSTMIKAELCKSLKIK